MLKHLLATFVVQFDVSQFGHNVGQQFNLISQMPEVNMRSAQRTIQTKWPLEVLKLVVQNGKKMMGEESGIKRFLKEVQVGKVHPKQVKIVLLDQRVLKATLVQILTTTATICCTPMLPSLATMFRLHIDEKDFEQHCRATFLLSFALA